MLPLYHHNKSSRKLIDHCIGFVFFGLLFWLAWEYFVERMCYQDSAGYSVELIKRQWFATVHDRTGAVFSQFIPIILIHLKAPLKAVLIGYSVNFIVLYAACFWFCLLVCRHRPAAYSICLLLVVGVNVTFFWPVTELLQGLVFTVVFFAWLNSQRQRNRIVHFTMAILLCWLALKTHPLTCVPLVLVICYDILDHRDRKIGQKVLRLGLVLVPAMFLLFKPWDSPYEQSLVPSLSQVMELLPHFSKLRGTTDVYNLLTGRYSVILKGLILLTLVLGAMRKWLKLALILTFHLGYLVLLCFTYVYGATELTFENSFLVFVMAQAIFFTHELWVPFAKFGLPQISLALFTLFFLFRIQDLGPRYVHKTTHFQSIANNLQGSPNRKLVFSSSNYPHHITMMTWPSSAESLLFSALEGPEKCFTFYVAGEHEIEQIKSFQPANDLFLEYSWQLEGAQDKLPKRYFDLPNQPYVFVNDNRSLSGDSILNMLSRTRLDWIDFCPEFRAGTKPYAHLKFSNQGPGSIPSTRMADNSVFLSYRYYLEDELIEWEPPKSTLLMDIQSTMEQLVLIEIPEHKEDYEIQFGLIGYNGNKFYLESPRYPIRVR